MQKLQELQAQLQESGVSDRELTITSGDNFVQVVDADMPDYPVFITVSDGEMECWINVVPVTAIPAENRGMLAHALLESHELTGLSTFSVGDGFYKLTGRLSADSKHESVVQDVESLFSTAQDSLALFLEFTA